MDCWVCDHVRNGGHSALVRELWHKWERLNMGLLNCTTVQETDRVRPHEEEAHRAFWAQLAEEQREAHVIVRDHAALCRDPTCLIGQVVMCDQYVQMKGVTG